MAKTRTCCPKPFIIREIILGELDSETIPSFELLDSGDKELLDSGYYELLDN